MALTSMARPPGQGFERLPLVDLLKAVAAQLIVLHHLAFYGPMSDHVAEWVPQLMEGLSRYGRLAVQVFLVVGGYLAARQLAPQGRLQLSQSPLRVVGDRYLRLALPYGAALALVIACSALVRPWLDHDSVPDAAQVGEVLIHLLLLQDLVGVEALSAGVWYVAIDFQLFVGLLFLLWTAARLGHRLPASMPIAAWLVLAVTLASLLVFNRDPEWDVAAPYFFGSYGLGVLAAWLPSAALRGRVRALAALLAVGVILALLLEFRSRIALAALIAGALALAGSLSVQRAGLAAAMTGWLSRISYSLFLVHFGVCLVVNAVFTEFLPTSPEVQAAGLLVAWGASLAAAALLHHWVERPCMALLRRPVLRAESRAG
jgi:peptidoglycan/LPS O-acetylase OafA/YrhL